MTSPIEPEKTQKISLERLEWELQVARVQALGTYRDLLAHVAQLLKSGEENRLPECEPLFVTPVALAIALSRLTREVLADLSSEEREFVEVESREMGDE